MELKMKNKVVLTGEFMKITVWKLFCQLKNQSLPGLLPLVLLLKCIFLIVGSKERVLFLELKECMQHLIWELNIGHLWSLFSFSFGGLGRCVMGADISWLASGCSSVTSCSSETSGACG